MISMVQAGHCCTVWRGTNQPNCRREEWSNVCRWLENLLGPLFLSWLPINSSL